MNFNSEILRPDSITVIWALNAGNFDRTYWEVPLTYALTQAFQVAISSKDMFFFLSITRDTDELEYPLEKWTFPLQK